MENKPFIDAYEEINSRFIKLLSSMSALRALSDFEVKHRNEDEIITDSLGVLLDYHELDDVAIFMYEEGVLKQVARQHWNEGEKHPPTKDDSSTDIHSTLLAKVAVTREIQRMIPAAGDESSVSLSAYPIQASDTLLGVFLASHPDDSFFSSTNERNLMVYCNFLGQMIMNNRLLHSMDKLVDERTQQLQLALDEAGELKRRYEELSIIDELTQLHNRRFFFPEARAVLARAMRYKKALSVLMLDLDYFKQINDRYGHAMGDEVLKDIAATIKAEVRDVDVLARFGGEEFVLALPETDERGARIMAERVLEKIKSQRWDVEGKAITITLTIGISVLENRSGNDSVSVLDELIQQADQALYYGKTNGRDQFNAYSAIACFL